MSLNTLEKSDRDERRLTIVSDAALLAMQSAVTAAVADHHRAGRPVAVWQNQRIVWLYPDGTTRPVEEQPAP
jgi:hypothetical protein